MRLLFKLFLGLVLLCAIGVGILVYAMRSMPFGPGGQDFAVSLPHGYSIQRSSAHQIIIWSDDPKWRDAVIPPKMVELDFDDNWLIAKQQHLQRRSPNDPGDTYEEPAPGQFSYWIADLQKGLRYGPLTEAEFAAKRQELGVPAALRLHDVYDYAP